MPSDSRSAWMIEAEAALCSIRGVEAARVHLEDDDVREIHVTSRSTRAAKQIVRDVQSVLAARFHRRIDHRVVSVAYLEDEPPIPARTSAVAPAPAPTPARAVAPSPADGTVARPEHPAPPAREAPTEPRIRFVGVNLYVAGSRVQAQVELRWKGLPRMGSASGWSTRDGAHRLVAQAALAGIQEFLADDLALVVQDVTFLRAGGRKAVLVAVSLVTPREERILLGTSLIGKDLHQAVVLATLSALNRLVGGLRTKEPTEYVLRPASHPGGSGASSEA